tara:strand:- start:1046 stop:1414 length:369 start_codon:yes stop_codon:yes gene_type:complete
MPGKNRPSRKAKLDIEGTVVFGRRSEESDLITVDGDNAVQVTIANNDNKAVVWLPKKCITWIPNGLELPIWLAAKVTKTEDLFRQNESAGREAVSKWRVVKPRTVNVIGKAKDKAVATFAGR